MTRIRFAVLVIVIGIAGSAQKGGGQTPGAQAFAGATLFDGAGARIEKAIMVVRNGRIESVGRSGAVTIPKDARTTTLPGQFVIPGLISAHVHISDVQGSQPRAYTDQNTLRQLGVFARYGVTTVWSLGGEQGPAFKARDAQDTPTLDRARMYVAGDVIAAKTPDQARQMVAKVAERKPDLIKIRVDDNLGTSAKMRRRSIVRSSRRRTSAGFVSRRISSTSMTRRICCARASM